MPIVKKEEINPVAIAKKATMYAAIEAKKAAPGIAEAELKAEAARKKAKEVAK